MLTVLKPGTTEPTSWCLGVLGALVVNDERSLRKAGARSDPYAVFARMLGRGTPPADWTALIAEARPTSGQDEPGP